MAQVKGSGSTRKATIASKARDVSQNTENLYNEALVDWAFEDLSIPSSKIIGTVTPALHAPSHSNGGTDEITIENLGTASANTAYALKPDGAGGLAFGAVGGGGAIDYDGTYTNSLVSTSSTVGAAKAIAIGYNSYATAASGIGFGNGAGSYAADGIAIGRGSYINANSSNSVAIGYNSYTTGGVAVAVGGNSYAAQYGVAVGKSSVANQGTIAVGHSASDDGTGTFNTLVGYDAYSTGAFAQGVAIGTNAKMKALRGIAVGPSAQVAGTDSVAIGRNAQTALAATNSVAIGPYVTNSVASSLKLGVSAANHISFETFSAVAETPAASHTLTIKIGAGTYKVLLST